MELIDDGNTGLTIDHNLDFSRCLSVFETKVISTRFGLMLVRKSSWSILGIRL